MKTILVDPLKFIAEYENSVTLVLLLNGEKIVLGKAIFSPAFYLSSDYRYSTNINRDTVFLYSDYYESLPYLITHGHSVKYIYKNAYWWASDMDTGEHLMAPTLTKLESRICSFYGRCK